MQATWNSSWLVSIVICQTNSIMSCCRPVGQIDHEECTPLARFHRQPAANSADIRHSWPAEKSNPSALPGLAVDRATFETAAASLPAALPHGWRGSAQ